MRELGDLLREHREAAGLTLRDLAPKLGRSIAHLHRIETGYRGTTSETEVVHYLATCGARYQDVEALITFCREAGDDRGYWLAPHGQWMSDSLRSLIFHETTATRSISYEPEVIPGLLQTEPYVRALLARQDFTDERRAALLQARMERQRILFRNNPTQFTFFVHERALRLEVGDYRTMAEQLLAMLFFADQRNIQIRILPSSARDTAVFGGAFRLLGYPKFAPLVYLDCHIAGLFLEDARQVADFQSLMRQIAKVALDAGQSRGLVATLADEYDRAEGGWDDARRVAQEQL
ncbi:helix-turn-helix domain-containing protein [Actinokineospora xionganensis]|uniref:Helix-turn-helix domain-containing protein n=1 Tax=Actinokineospora xionganensis TaxID=2684470 RepID=A0ABR7L1Z7_9PSEU|nr:helix-turn-helix transcriptional regulator [Actinokineospora xionganensis]MBC6446464.1 helix-turn-helix domain-containing protein [Actinokineospora xionganensis]